ncbi:FAM32A [Branchiostoma lanceolatum]|uniref:FAM32A protein n=1 Tax=Branchiostoma lanceolatum TaxID=7740 RepID=A0A8J9ZJ11_BRALA|nr:FAM32A [Branchiostoma lanceolatum]
MYQSSARSEVHCGIYYAVCSFHFRYRKVVVRTMSSAYDTVQKGSLKLKGPENGGIKKKKKKKKEKRRMLEQITSKEATSEEGVERSKKPDMRTPAQRKFAQVQERRQMERVLNKAALTHKQRVESFNAHLDRLTEHYDIPKVSWTK